MRLYFFTDCPQEFRQHGAACYLVNHNSSTFNDASNFCQERDSFLVEPRTEGQNDKVKWYRNNIVLWIGLKRDSFPLYKWLWERNGEELDEQEALWGHGEPNGGGNGQCVELHVGGTYWNDKSCGQRRQVVCQYPGKSHGVNCGSQLGTKWENLILFEISFSVPKTSRNFNFF